MTAAGDDRTVDAGEQAPLRLWLSCSMEAEGKVTATGASSGPEVVGSRFTIQANGMAIEMVLVSYSGPPMRWDAVDAASYEQKYGIREAR